MKPPGTYCTTMRLSCVAPVAGPTRILSAAPPTLAASKPARIAPLGCGSSAASKWSRQYGNLEPRRQRVVLDEDGVLERRARLRRADLEPAHRRARVVAQRMGDAAIDEHVVVRAELLGRTGGLEDERALEHVERLLERVQVALDAAARLELGDHDLLVDASRRRGR